MIEALWPAVEVHPYLVLFPLIVIEGPLATVVAGSLVAAGTMTFPLAGALAIAAEISADTAFFTAGRLARHQRVARHLPRLGLTEARRAPLEASLARNLPGVLAGAKIADAAAIPVILAAGASGVGYGRFLAWNLALSVPKSLLLLALGAVFGIQAKSFFTPATSVLVAVGAVAAYLALASYRTSRAARTAHRSSGITHLQGVPS